VGCAGPHPLPQTPGARPPGAPCPLSATGTEPPAPIIDTAVAKRLQIFHGANSLSTLRRRQGHRFPCQAQTSRMNRNSGRSGMGRANRLPDKHLPTENNRAHLWDAAYDLDLN
jgi:hypothetical protein